MLKKSCPECGSIIEVDESKHQSETTIKTRCQLCGTEVEFLVQDKPTADKTLTTIQKVVEVKEAVHDEIKPDIAEIPQCNNIEFSVDNQDELSYSKSGNSINKLLITIICVAVIVLIWLLVGKSDNMTDGVEAVIADSIAVEEVEIETVEPETNTKAEVNKAEKGFENFDTNVNTSRNTNTIISVTTDCSWKKMADGSDAYMMIPDYLQLTKTLENGGKVYDAENGSYLISLVAATDMSPKDMIFTFCKDYKQTYTRDKDNWAVSSGVFDEYFYYAKARRIDNLNYFAFYVVPKNEKYNAKAYSSLTETIFSNSNFPTIY